MKEAIFYIILFIVCYSFYNIFVYRRKNVYEKFKDGKEIKYLKLRYKIKINDKNINKLSQVIFLSNSFILTTTVVIVSLLESLLLQLLVGFVVLLVLILGIYHIIGISFKKSGGE